MWPHVTDRLRGEPGFSLDPKAEPFWTLHCSFSSKLLYYMPHPCFFCVRLIFHPGGSWPWTTPNYNRCKLWCQCGENSETLSLLPAWPVTLQGRQAPLVFISCPLLGVVICRRAGPVGALQLWPEAECQREKSKNDKDLGNCKCDGRNKISKERPQRRKTYFRGSFPGDFFGSQWLRIPVVKYEGMKVWSLVWEPRSHILREARPVYHN